MQLNDDGNVLSGTSLNDEDDMQDTLSSLNSAEKSLGSKMATPETDMKFYQINGNKYQNLLAENEKIQG